MGIVRAVEQEHGEQQQRGDGKQRKNHARMLVPAIVDLHGQRHGQHAAQCPEQLLQDEVIGRTKPFLGHHGGSTEHHDQADEHEQHRDRKQPSIDTDTLGHESLFDHGVGRQERF